MGNMDFLSLQKDESVDWTVYLIPMLTVLTLLNFVCALVCCFGNCRKSPVKYVSVHMGSDTDNEL